MTDIVVGTCSQCKGPMVLVGPHCVPACRQCHAKAKNPYGPVIETESKETGPQLLNEST